MFGILRPGSPGQGRASIAHPSSPPPARTLAPMPGTDFSGREELLAGVKDWAADQGYAVVIARSRFNRLWLKCDRGGTYENRRNLTADQRKRKRGESRLLGCPFKMLATVKKDGVWHVETEIPDHNHGPSEDLRQHPTLRRMTEEQLQKVHEMCDSGNSPAETIEVLRRSWPDIKVLTRDIYNARKKYKTTKDLAEAATGIAPPQPYQDPNGLIPGPDSRGRWAWVPEGEEVTNKKGKRRRRAVPPSQPTLDPQLQTPNGPTIGETTLGSPNQNLLGDYQNGVDSSFLQSQFSEADTAPNDDNVWTESPLFDGSAADNAPSRLQSQVPSNSPNTDNVSTVASGADLIINPPANAPEKPPSGHVLMSRMERMEKEQRDQKNMLAQILGAVKGFSGNSTSN